MCTLKDQKMTRTKFLSTCSKCSTETNAPERIIFNIHTTVSYDFCRIFKNEGKYMVTQIAVTNPIHVKIKKLDLGNEMFRTTFKIYKSKRLLLENTERLINGICFLLLHMIPQF